MKDLYVIEKRDEHGALDFSAPQPEDCFGSRAITGISEDQMAQWIWKLRPDAVLDGREVPLWPRKINDRFTARRKTW